jgi:hypothetical protein
VDANGGHYLFSADFKVTRPLFDIAFLQAVWFATPNSQVCCEVRQPAQEGGDYDEQNGPLPSDAWLVLSAKLLDVSKVK